MPGDKPWFCWFNQTVLEFFIYVEKNVHSSDATTTQDSSYPSSTTSPSSSTIPPSSSRSSPSLTSLPPVSTASLVNAAAVHDSNHASFFPSSFSHPSDHVSDYKAKPRQKRDYRGYDHQRNDYNDYPLLIKIEEKRKAYGNVQPYCQQMQILDNQDIVVRGEVPQIPVPEDPGMDGVRKRSWEKRKLEARDTYDDLQRNCACLWMAGG
jgi:hypothetical protein